MPPRSQLLARHAARLALSKRPPLPANCIHSKKPLHSRPFTVSNHSAGPPARTYGKDRKRGTPRKSPTTTDSSPGYSDKVYADGIVSAQSQFPPTTYSPSMRQSIETLGIQVNLDMVINSALVTLKQRSSSKDAVSWVLGDYSRNRNFPLGGSDAQIAYVHFLIGTACLYEKQWQRLGRHMLAIATEIGNLQAAMQLCAQENLHRDYIAPPGAAENLNLFARQGHDWRSLSIQVKRWLLGRRPDRTEEAFQLAQKCFDIAEPSSNSEEEPLEQRIVCDPPWRVLFEAAKWKGDKEVATKALNAGLSDYRDPAAYQIWSQASNLVPRDEEVLDEFARDLKHVTYSGEWVERTTQAALMGEPVALWNIGQYHLERCGWFPCTKKVSSRTDRWIAFEWLKLHALRSPPTVARSRILLVALILRDSGFFREGSEYLEQGMELIKQGTVGDMAERDRAIQELSDVKVSYQKRSGGLVSIIGDDIIEWTAEHYAQELRIRPQMGLGT